MKEKYLKKFLLKTNKIKKHKNYTKEKIDEIFDNLSEYEKYKTNEYILLKTEDKEKDYLYCSEIGRIDKEKTIFDYKNVLEWDKKWWQFQKDSISEENLSGKNQKKWFKTNYKKYNTLYMIGEWFRWIEKEDFDNKSSKGHMVYGTLISLNSYIVTEVSEFIDKKIDKKYPNMFYKKYRKPMFKKIKDSKFSTMEKLKIRAGGYEKELEVLKKLKRKNFYKIEKLILKSIEKYSNYTFTKWTYEEYKKSEKIENGIKNMIFGGKKAAEKINYNTFLDDFYKLEQPFGIVEKLIKKINKKIEKKYLKKWIKKSKKIKFK